MKPAPAFFSYVLLCLIGTIPTNSIAENWKSVGEGFYVDIDSSSRRGDIASVNVRNGRSIDRESFDCKKRLLLSGTGKEIPISEWAVLDGMFKAACTRWYEVWKR
jgi:hypothetical protein